MRATRPTRRSSRSSRGSSRGCTRGRASRRSSRRSGRSSASAGREPQAKLRCRGTQNGVGWVPVSRRTGDWLLIVLLVGSWAVLFARGLGDGVRNQRGQVRVTVSSAVSADAYPVVIRQSIHPEVQPGDVVLAVDGVDLRGAS